MPPIGFQGPMWWSVLSDPQSQVMPMYLSAARYMPVRAMGLIYLEADANRRLKVELPAARTSTPRVAGASANQVPQLSG